MWYQAELAAAKVGSIGFMVGWAKNPAAAVAAATVRKSSLTVLDSLSSDADAPAPPQVSHSLAHAFFPSERSSVCFFSRLLATNATFPLNTSLYTSFYPRGSWDFCNSSCATNEHASHH